MTIHEIAELSGAAATLFTLVGGLKVVIHVLVRMGELLEQIKGLGTGHSEMKRTLEALGIQVLKLRLKQEKRDGKRERHDDVE